MYIKRLVTIGAYIFLFVTCLSLVAHYNYVNGSFWMGRRALKMFKCNEKRESFKNKGMNILLVVIGLKLSKQ